MQTGRLPVPRGATLEWIGISEEGVCLFCIFISSIDCFQAPAIYDSNGLLSILDRFRRPTQARWVPLLDTTALARRQGKDESYWPVGVSGTLLMCIILKVCSRNRLINCIDFHVRGKKSILDSLDH